MALPSKLSGRTVLMTIVSPGFTSYLPGILTASLPPSALSHVKLPSYMIFSSLTVWLLSLGNTHSAIINPIVKKAIII